MSERDETPQRQAIGELCSTYPCPGGVEVWLAFKGEDGKGVVREELQMTAVDAVNLAQALIRAAVKSMQSAIAGEVT